jgi:chromosome segregation ATPase
MRFLGFRIDAALLAGMLLLSTTLASAQTARSGGTGNAQLMQQMQQLASDRTSLQAENAKLKKELDDLRKDRDALKTAQQALTRRATSSELALKQQRAAQAQQISADRELTQTKSKMDQLIAKFRETLETMRALEAEQNSTKQTLATREQALKVCAERNVALYQVNEEVLTRLEHQSAWARTAQGEPFIRIKRNQLENLVDDYKQRADSQKVTPAQPTSVPAAQSPSMPEATPH